MKDEETNAAGIDVWELPPENAGQRLDLALCARHPELSRTRIQNAIREGAVMVDGRPASTLSMRMEAGRRIAFRLPPAPDEDGALPQPDASIRVETLFEAIVLRKEVTPVNYMPIELLTRENVDFYRRTFRG